MYFQECNNIKLKLIDNEHFFQWFIQKYNSIKQAKTQKIFTK